MPSIVDSQIHIWRANSPEHPWPIERVRYAHGPSEFGAEDILQVMESVGVDRALLVPAFAAGDSNDFALQAAAKYSDRFKVFGRMAMAAPSAQRTLLDDLERGLTGVRLSFLDQDAVHLTNGSLDWLWPLAEARDIPLMLWPPSQLPALLEIAEAHPKLRIALDHMGLAFPDDPQAPERDLDQTLRLADCPNVCLKATSYAWFGKEGPPFPGFLRLVRRAIDAFGANRVFWGTDYSRLPCDYATAIRAFDEPSFFRSPGEKDLVMGEAVKKWLGW
ncbi:putative metal-dependent hydrolase of the TIM-barrel fold protein (plasmid) [Variovorax sp. SRS16]|uniref:amidohydrolase family protein n=1 Tax=Variovorax sp. SRS16 TaxID=282217 RepID=UPI0013178EF5|nr:amidohydrolase family protein [Variovorax sp. SRS16]VTU45384.1 putative metal-dependent hydrolase of the TIM-barrel fold protein [Variovorax sp. SRS16]